MTDPEFRCHQGGMEAPCPNAPAYRWCLEGTVGYVCREHVQQLQDTADRLKVHVLLTPLPKPA